MTSSTHDHDSNARCGATASLRRNEDGERKDLTPARRRILEILSAASRPLGAYELIDRVAEATGKRPAPISVYRALDFLLEAGLIHRLATRNAYLACGCGHARAAPIVFLICERCGEVAEADSAALDASLRALTEQAGFAPRTQAIEVAGVCSGCSRLERY